MSEWQTRGQRRLKTREDTVNLGRELGQTLRGGDVVILDGPLGAGKTALASGIAQGLEVTGRVASPTFVIARHHRPSRPGTPGMIHVDAYRLRGADPGAVPQWDHVLDEFDALDLDTDLIDNVVVVEWGVGLADALAATHLEVTLERFSDNEERLASWQWNGIAGTAIANE